VIYLTGDLHGDESRLYAKDWFKLKKGDILIILGDFGFLWNGGKKERDVIEWLGKRPYTVCFLDGAHENFDMLKKCRLTRWKGGKVRRVSGNLFHLCRGQIFKIDGVSFFTFGGGESEDRDGRIAGKTWWRQEMPTPNEMKEGALNLEENGQQVDYILTHEPPTLVKSAMALRKGRELKTSHLNGYLQEIDNECEFNHWYFGSMHEDRLITPKHTCLFQKIILMGSKEQI
jgi:hypothetical protein